MQNASRRVRLAVLVTAMLLTVACSGDDTDLAVEPPAGEAPVATDDDGAPAATASSAPDGQAPPATADGTAGEPSSPPPPPPPSAPAGTGAPPSTVDAPPPAPAGVGTYAGFYLRPAESSRIQLSIRSQSGAGPRGATVDHVGAVLRQVSGKTVELAGGSVPGDGRQWTAADIRGAADRGGTPQSRERSVMTVLFLKGGFAGSDTALGVAVRSDVAAIFVDRVQEAAGVFADAARIEDAVTVHEVGHLLGLVDLFLDTGRADPEHPGHSPNRESVMYFAVESTLVGDLLAGGPPREFDQADLDDLARIRES